VFLPYTVNATRAVVTPGPHRDAGDENL
jgi:hypothetical protein